MTFEQAKQKLAESKGYKDWESLEMMKMPKSLSQCFTGAAELWQQSNLERIKELEDFVKSISEMDANNLTEDSQKRWHELKDYEFDWKSFYTGWIESRVKFILSAKQLLK